MSLSEQAEFDVVVIGGGIVGLATAWALTGREANRSVAIVEKEPDVAAHQTGHNSGVLHSGIYYKPGSLKAVNCRRGRLAMEQFCEREGIPFDICGKVIVAVDDSELARLEDIYERGQANGVKCELISADRLRELEPRAAGVRAIHVPETGIVDFRAVCRRLSELLTERGACVMTSTEVHRVLPSNGRKQVVESTAGTLTARHVVNCAGLHCDRVARSAGTRLDAKIIPFRGEYYELVPTAFEFCRNLIYPVPDPSFPFLGVHFTRMIDGGVECGPNAVLALAREGYRHRDINLRDLAETLGYGGFWRLAAKYWYTGAGETWRSLNKRAFVRALQRLVPEIRGEHLRAAPAGVRAQAVAPNGALVDDFLIQAEDGVIHVGNAPSPAATSALNIGQIIADHVEGRVP